MSTSRGESTRLLVVDDDPGMHTLVQELSANESTTVLSAMTLADGLRIAAQQRVDVVLLDHMLPDGEGLDRIPEFIAHDRLRPILYITAKAGSKTAIEAIKRGAFEYLSKPIDFQQLRQRIAEAIEYRRLTRLPVLVDSQSTEETQSDTLVGRCRGMQEVYKGIGRLSGLRTPLLIEGEIGTGKEMIARAIHQNSTCASGPFRKIASKEFDDTELQIELFGASNPSASAAGHTSPLRISALLAGTGGTLMIDDIDSWSIATQSRLLRFFQSKVIEGFSVDTRVILATSLKVRDLVQTGKIQSDLFYFLSPFMIRVPALRDRQEDLELLVAHFMQRIANVSSAQPSQGPPRVSNAAMQLLKDYDWPGNIAELKSVLVGVLTESRGAVLATDALMQFLDVSHKKGETIDATSSQPTIASSQPTIASWPGKEISRTKPEPSKVWDLKAFVDQQIASGTERLYEQAISLLDEQLLSLVMQHTHGNRLKAAKLLGITRTSLRKKMTGSSTSEPESGSSDRVRPDDEHA